MVNILKIVLLIFTIFYVDIYFYGLVLFHVDLVIVTTEVKHNAFAMLLLIFAIFCIDLDFPA